ncbi:hypothetical protein EG329_006455 [Mollisiaceae sp. DMI_Dod_QoI]|nr:hypothetical protein EG329_006455 [Helotiales sp. DMI_Dod_QoI]
MKISLKIVALLSIFLCVFVPVSIAETAQTQCPAHETTGSLNAAQVPFHDMFLTQPTSEACACNTETEKTQPEIVLSRPAPAIVYTHKNLENCQHSKHLSKSSELRSYEVDTCYRIKELYWTILSPAFCQDGSRAVLSRFGGKTCTLGSRVEDMIVVDETILWRCLGMMGDTSSFAFLCDDVRELENQWFNPWFLTKATVVTLTLMRQFGFLSGVELAMVFYALRWLGLFSFLWEFVKTMCFYIVIWYLGSIMFLAVTVGIMMVMTLILLGYDNLCHSLWDAD